MHVRFIAKGKKPMPETRRNPQHMVIDFRKLDANPAPECGRTAPQIDRDVKHRTACASNQLSLRPIQLIVHAAQDVAHRPGVIVLAKVHMEAGTFKCGLVP